MTPNLAPRLPEPVCPIVGLDAFSALPPHDRAASAPILFASPHSGAKYPQQMLDQLRVPLIELRRTEDAFIDRLFNQVPELGGHLVHANYARSYVDLNRDARELDPTMFADAPPRVVAIPTPRVEAGLGCLPKVSAAGELIYAQTLSKAEGEYRLAHVHDTYHGYVRATLDHFRAETGVAVLIDCHSMPSRQPGKRRLPDIVLGDRFGSTCSSKLTGLAERTFRKLGYAVMRNAPYAGGYTTRCYGRPRRGVHALQIEINRSLYMDEVNVELTDGFSTLRHDLQTVIRALYMFTRAQMA